MQEQQYILKNVKSFEPRHIFECGQCFRWDEEPNGSYTGIVKNNVINVEKVENTITFSGFVSPGGIAKEPSGHWM